ncbi:hypothetical protein XHV734_0205 [Xanthomonas hortorum pv. vitians]|nr:hypothetical protein XHV734_0205 [Xanthomonas hortorum pv. vitians]
MRAATVAHSAESGLNKPNNTHSNQNAHAQRSRKDGRRKAWRRLCPAALPGLPKKRLTKLPRASEGVRGVSFTTLRRAI